MTKFEELDREFFINSGRDPSISVRSYRLMLADRRLQERERKEASSIWSYRHRLAEMRRQERKRAKAVGKDTGERTEAV